MWRFAAIFDRHEIQIEVQNLFTTEGKRFKKNTPEITHDNNTAFCFNIRIYKNMHMKSRPCNNATAPNSAHSQNCKCMIVNAALKIVIK